MPSALSQGPNNIFIDSGTGVSAKIGFDAGTVYFASDVANFVFSQYATIGDFPGTERFRFNIGNLANLLTNYPVLSKYVRFRSTGTPEGAETAIVGTICTRNDGGSGTTLYVKESGSGSTGWTAVSASSGFDPHSPGTFGDVTPAAVAATTLTLPGGIHLDGYTGNYFGISGSGGGQLAVSPTALYVGANSEIGWASTADPLSVGNPTTKLVSPAANTLALSHTNGQKTTIGGVLFNDFTDTATTHTDGTEDDLFSHTLAANQLAVNGDSVEQVEHVSFVSSATASRRLKKYFGGTLIFDSGVLTLTLGGEFDIFTYCIRESSTVVRCCVSVTSTSASSIPYSNYTRVTGLTLSGTNILKTTGIAAGTGAASADIADKSSKVWWFPASY